MTVTNEAGTEGEPERRQDSLEIFMERYLWSIAKSPDQVADLFPALFYDTDELPEKEFGRRMHAATGDYLHGVHHAEGRYRKMEEPPIFIERDEDHSNARYRINRPFFETRPFFQTEVYKQLSDFIGGIVEGTYEIDPSLYIPISDLGLTKRAFNSLNAANFQTVADLVRVPGQDFLKYRNLGKQCLYEVAAKLDDRGVFHKLELGVR